VHSFKRIWSWARFGALAAGLVMRVGITDAQSTLITLVSPPGDYIGQGQTYQTTNFSFTGGAGSVVASAFGFNFTIVAPSGQNFLVGTYYNTTRYPFNGIGPGIDISGNGRGCNMECGSFQILEIHVNTNGSIDRLWLQYTNSCECFDAAMSGEIRYNSQLAAESIPPTITTPPITQTVVQGNTANLTVTASGSPPLSYQWYFNNTNLPGQTGSELTIPNVQPANQGIYSVTVTNAYGSTNSVPVQLSAVPTPSCLPAPSGIISWWQGEGNALDVIGTNDGVLVGDVGFEPGKDGLAFAFTNGNSYVAIADSPSLDLSSNDFTIELWANFASLGGSQALIAKDEGPGDTDKWIFWLNNGKLQMALDGGLTLGGGPFIPASGQWYHLAVTRSGSTFSFYTNGVLSSANAAPVTIPVIDAPVTIGEAEGSYFMNGLEDEITIYSRALSSAEIQTIYNADSAGKCAPVMAPVVITAPQNQAVYAGQNATLSVLAAGSSPLAYQWSVNNSNLPGATNVSLTLTNVQPGQSGNYSVSVSNLVGSTNSGSALLNVLVPGSCLPAPPGVISWWAGEGTANDSVGTNMGMLEDGATYAPGEDGLAFSFTNLGGTGYVSIPDSPSLDLSTNDFTIELWAQFASLGGSRAFIAKDPAGGTINKWMFWLNNGQLQFQYVNGTTVVMVGTGAFSPNIDQWYHVAVTRSGSLFSFYANGALVSSGVNSLGIPPIAAPVTIGEAENNFYQGGQEDEVTIYGRALSATEVQDIYLAGNAGKCAVPTPPVLVVSPQATSVPTGINVTFQSLAAGTSPLSYQWLFENTNITGATNFTLQLTNVQAAQAGDYSVVITNTFGVTNSTNAVLTVFPAVCEPPPTGIVGWWAGQGNANDSFGTNNGTLEGGAGFGPGEVGQAFSFNGSSQYMQAPDSSNWDFGTHNYSIELWAKFNSAGGTQTLVAHDTGGGQLNKWMFWLSGGQLQMYVFSQATGIVAMSSGAFTPVVNQWYHLGVTRNGSVFSFYVDGVLDGIVTNAVAIPVASTPLTIGEAENGNYLAGEEDEVTIYDRALSTAEMQAIYDAGSAGKCSLPPVITSQPQSETVAAGATASFNVMATGNQPLSYQWLVNQSNIPAATNATLILTNAQASQSGNNYSVLVMNNAGSTNSSNAVLTVLPPTCDPPPAGLVGWWAGQGNANDSFGTNNGSLVGGVTFTSGEVGEAFSFNGTNQYVDVPDSPDLDPVAGITCEAWIYLRQPATSATAPVIKKAGQGLATQGGYALEIPTNGAIFSVYVNGTWVPTGYAPFPLDQWVHVAGVYDGTNVSIYLNGVRVGAPVSAPGTITPASNDLNIGHDPAVPSRYFNGLIDEASVYNTALSAAQIKAIYNAGSAGKCLLPPVITGQPQGQTVTSGSTTGFSVTATGSQPLGYQWLVNNSVIPGATNASLTLASVQTNLSGNLYSVLITNPAGSTNSAGALLTVNIQPTIIPSTNDLWDISQGSVVTSNSGVNVPYSDIRDMFGGQFSPVEPGDTVFADGDPPGFVHWVEWQTPGPVNVSSFALFGSDDGASYNYQRAFAQFVLRAKSSAAATNYDLTLYTLVVSNHPYLFLDPVHFAIIAPTITPVTAQYFRAEFTQYTAGFGFDGPRVIELDGFGSNAPVIVTGPSNQTVIAGQSVTFAVSVTGNAPLYYQWQVNRSNILGATNAMLVLTNAQVGESGNLYSITVSNSLGSTNSPSAALTVIAPVCDPPPSGLVDWWQGEGNANDSFGTNNGSLINGVTFTNGEVGRAFSFNGTSDYVSISASPTLDVGQGSGLTLEAWIRPADLSQRRPLLEWNNSSPTMTFGVHFWVSQGPPYGPGVGCLYANIEDPSGNNHYLASAAGILVTNQFQHVALTYDKASGIGTIYLNGVVVAQQNLGSVTPETSYPFYIGYRPSGDGAGTLFSGAMDEVSLYNRALVPAEVQAIYDAGSAGKCPAPPLIMAGPTNQSAPLGSSATFTVGAVGSQPLGYQWRINQQSIPLAVNPTANNATLILTNVQPKDGGNYSVLVTNFLGSTNSSNALLTLLFPPSVTVNPPEQLANLGCSVAFAASATGSGSLTYQWLKNDTNLPGQTTTNLIIPSVSVGDFANYTMIASNAYGAATSAVAVLAMDHLPVPGSVIIQRYPNGGIRINASSLPMAATDADGDPISLISVASNSIAGGMVTWSGNSIYYLPPAGQTNADAFNYTLSDGHCGGTSVGTVLVEVRTDSNPASRVMIVEVGDGSVQVIFDGIPEMPYQIQGADTLSPPDWQTITNLTANQYGTYIYTDWPATNGPVRYFRSISP
jgi:Concanavalin A-like lectin/glucanases superfamily/Immunoglobulin domain/Bacterial Ig domain